MKTTKIDPSTELGRRVGWICEQLRSRVEVVGAAQAAGLPLRPHPEALPANIYATGGDWERWATPGRDARLRAEVGALRDFLQSLLPSLPRREQRALAKAWSETAGADSCVVTYHDSAGGAVRLSLDAVLDRLYALSFDPWDCPERRWGAPPGSPELRTCVSDASTGRFYEVERRLRNRLERGWGDPTPPDSGPDQPPLIDFRPLLRRR